MATSGYTAVYTTSDNTIYNAWVQALYDSLIAMGLTQTADTGQLAVSPVTVGFPGANNTFSGYWIFRFNDSMQSSAPIYFKFRMGRGNGSANHVIELTVGTGSNGSGTITGVVLAATQITSTTWAPSTTVNTRIEGCYNTSVGCFWMAFDVASNNGGGAMCISRTLDSSGTPSADGWVAIMHQTTTGIVFGSYEVASGTVRAPVGVYPFPYAPFPGQSLMSSSVGSVVYMYPAVLQVGTAVKQLGGIYGVGKATFLPHSTVSINQFGTSRTYRAVSTHQLSPCGWDYAARSGTGPLLIWE